MVILTFVRQPLNADDGPVYPGCCRISCRVFCCLVAAVIGCFTPIHRPYLGSSLHTLTLPAAWRQVSSISILLAHSRVHAARDLHVTASAQSKCLSVTRSSHSHIACGMAAGFVYSILLGLARNRNSSSARYVCSARVNLSCWQDICVTSESTGSRSKMICSEMFVFCSGLLVSLAFES